MPEATEDFLRPAEAASKLADLLPEKSAEAWAAYLSNNRVASRPNAYRIPFSKLGHAVLYAESDLIEFAKWAKISGSPDRLSSRIKELAEAFGDTRTGRHLDCQITSQIDEESGEPFVQFIASDPTRVYRLSIEQAANIAAKLVVNLAEAVAEAKALRERR